MRAPSRLLQSDPDIQRAELSVRHLLPEELSVLPGNVSLPAPHVRCQSHSFTSSEVSYVSHGSI